MAKFSWRSIWRNKRRTIITCLAVGFGLAALLFSDGLMQGMAVYMVSGTTDPWMGDAQIHRDGYLDTRELELTINDPDSIVAMMAGDTSVTAYTERVLSSASLSSAREMKPVMLTGVDRLTDPRITMLQTAIDTGSYFTCDSM